MAQAKTKPKGKVRETTDKAGEVARNIWLAGLGAYGKAYDEAVARYEKASRETPKLFRDLVRKGESLEAPAKAKPQDNTLTRARADIEERLQAVRENIGLGHLFGSQHADLKRLEEKLDAMNSKLDALARALQAGAKVGSGQARRKAPAGKARAGRKPRQ